jgi:site-specific recombinase XerD
VFTGFLIFGDVSFYLVLRRFIPFRRSAIRYQNQNVTHAHQNPCKPALDTCSFLIQVLLGSGQLLKFIIFKAIAMTTKSFGVLFYLKSRRGWGDSPCDIYLRITVNGARQDLSLQRKCVTSMWNRSSGRATGKKEQVKALNAYLDTIEAKAHEARHFLLQLGRPVTPEYIRDILRGRAPTFEKKHMLMELFQEHNDRMWALVGKEYAAGTLTRFKTAAKHTRDFLLWKCKVADIDIKDLSYEFVCDFEHWFKTVKNCNHNTTIKFIACCRKIVLQAIRKGWLQRDPFLGFTMALREVDREALNKDELQVMATRQFPCNRLTQVRDMFLFSCYTGLAYIDLKKLRRNEISTGIDGGKWIFTKRKKTDTPSRIPLLPDALNILAKYESHPACLVRELVLPILSNQKMNAYLKEIGDLCGIQKNLTFHIARHTFATTVTLSNGVPIETVSKILGHTNLKTTQHYAKIQDLKVSQDMQVLREKLSAGTAGLGGAIPLSK